MCGIVGAVNWSDGSSLRLATELQTHRGPDDGDVWEHRSPDGTHIGLGSRRLAILDLSPAGRMPMVNAQQTVWITYNGEVYNFAELRQELSAKGYRFRSHTDTEVILHLYEEEGPECVKRLNGMFAFAICDLRSGRPLLFLARDHFGIKPLYYLHRGRQFAFASEVKSLLQLPGVSAAVDPVALQQYLTFLWVPDPATLFQGIVKLPAGHYAVFRHGNLEITQYWDLSFPPVGQSAAHTEADLIDELRERFRRSVYSQMVSDVPIGAFLSAGVDSSSIVAMMAERTTQPLRTYTVTFPSQHRKGELTLDDPQVAKRVARHFGCAHHEMVVEPQVADLLPRLIWYMDEPIADPAIITAYLVCREARKTVSVLLSGIGGDEIFAGYRKHYAHYWAHAYRQLPAFLRRGVIEPTIAALPSFRGSAVKGLVRLSKKMTRSATLSPPDAFLMNSTYFDKTQRNALLAPDVLAQMRGADPWQQHRHYFAHVVHADFLHQMLYVDTKAFMTSLNLTYNDKMSMATSVETRVPFLDRELVEFAAWQIPPALKLKGFWRPTTKHILRRAMAGIVPSEILRQPKAGFGTPLDAWVTHDLREMIGDLLSESRVRRRGYFVPRFVQGLLAAHQRGDHDWSLQIWQLLTFELWLQAFVDRPQTSHAAYTVDSARMALAA